ncbi:hypothetical protein V6Z11_A12G304100 [Gossypium hirsutum]
MYVHLGFVIDLPFLQWHCCHHLGCIYTCISSPFECLNMPEWTSSDSTLKFLQKVSSLKMNKILVQHAHVSFVSPFSRLLTWLYLIFSKFFHIFQGSYPHIHAPICV